MPKPNLKLRVGPMMSQCADLCSGNTHTHTHGHFEPSYIVTGSLRLQLVQREFIYFFEPDPILILLRFKERPCANLQRCSGPFCPNILGSVFGTGSNVRPTFDPSMLRSAV